MNATEARPGSKALLGRLFVWLQYVVPQHGLSRLVLAATRVRTPWFKDALIRAFLRLYDVDMRDAVQSDPCSYPNFNDFFTRALRPETRPVAADPRAIVCPVDGTVSECGDIDGDLLMQAKGRRYTVADLLAGQSWAPRFAGGSFATIYLAPFNYHRVHMPLRGRLEETWFVPGRLFSVNGLTARFVPRLFARNERIVTLFDTEAGACALVLVGALNVGSMATVWAGDIAPAARRMLTKLPPHALTLERGEEVGRFNMGSTIILLFEPQRVSWHSTLKAGLSVRLGESIGMLQ